jgi:GH25 family lysozyme M1 (1,4-beta-N-acetylmuramidase)
MPAPRFVDMSQWQPATIDWKAYLVWAAQWNGTAHLSLRSTVGLREDAHYKAYLDGARSMARALGIPLKVVHYHYAYPQISGAAAQANYQRQFVGSIPPNDVLMLDYEEQVDAATSQWAWEFAFQQHANYGKYPTIYASDSYIRNRLQDHRLVVCPLTLAKWSFDPNSRPPCPPPWSAYEYLQYTDRATVPGIGGPVDANIFLGADLEEPMILTIHDVEKYFSVKDANTWVRIDGNKRPVLDSAGQAIVLKGTLLSDFCSLGYDALALRGLPTANQVPVPGKTNVFFQAHERADVILDTNKPKISDNPPHSGQVYHKHIEPLRDAQARLDTAVSQLNISETKIADIQTQLAAALKTIAELSAGQSEAPALNALKQVKAIIDPLLVEGAK